MYTQMLPRVVGILLVSLSLSWTSAEGAETHAALMEKYGLKAGMKITRENAHLIKDLVPETFYQRVVKGEYTLTIGTFDPPDALTKVFTEEYYQASERNAGKYDVDAEGGIIEKATGQRPWPMPYGLPFPKIDLNEDPKKVGVKIQWSAFSLQATFNENKVFGGIPLNSFAYGAQSPDRYVVTSVARQLTEFRAIPLEIKRPVIFQEIFFFLEPSDAFGTANLTWRWADPKKWDSVWNYSPSTRRIRRLTAANRSDSTFGTEFVQDDANLYNGKIEMFDWKYVGQRAMLMPIWRLKTQALDDSVVKLPIQAEAGSLPNSLRVQDKYWKFGFHETPQQHASWWPLDQLWAVVPAYMVEGLPKDPYYNYGRQIFWYEANTFASVWKEIYNRSGEYWRTLFQFPEFMAFPVGGKPFVCYDVNTLIAVDEITNRGLIAPGSMAAGVLFPKAAAGKKEYNAGLDPELFSLGRFLEFGK